MSEIIENAESVEAIEATDIVEEAELEQAPVDDGLFHFVDEPEDLPLERREFLVKRIERIKAMAQRKQDALDKLAAICEPLGVDPNEIQLFIPHHGTDPIPLTEASLAGIRCFSENRLMVSGQVSEYFPEITWIYTGDLLYNRMDEVVAGDNMVYVIRDMDYLSILNRWLLARGLHAGILLEVNLSGNHFLDGILPALCQNVARMMDLYPTLTLEGFALDLPQDCDAALEALAKIRELAAAVIKHYGKKENVNADQIMVKNFCDWSCAIEGGATILPIAWNEVIVEV